MNLEIISDPFNPNKFVIDLNNFAYRTSFLVDTKLDQEVRIQNMIESISTEMSDVVKFIVSKQLTALVKMNKIGEEETLVNARMVKL